MSGFYWHHWSVLKEQSQLGPTWLPPFAGGSLIPSLSHLSATCSVCSSSVWGTFQLSTLMCLWSQPPCGECVWQCHCPSLRTVGAHVSPCFLKQTHIWEPGFWFEFSFILRIHLTFFGVSVSLFIKNKWSGWMVCKVLIVYDYREFILKCVWVSYVL